MAKQVIVQWTPSPSNDVARQELTLLTEINGRRRQHGPFRLGPHQSQWSTKEQNIPLNEGDSVEVTIVTIDKRNQRDINPPTRGFTIPDTTPPESASNLTFTVRDYDGGPTGPVGPTGPAH